MGRAIGSKNPDYERRRSALAGAAIARLVADNGVTSFNELAAAVGVSVPTLRHYFRDRAGLVAAALRDQRRRARPHLERVARPSSPALGESLSEFLLALVHAWRAFGVGRLFSAGLAMGLQSEAAGPAYLDGVLEPTLAAVEQRLRAHAREGALRLDPDDAEGLRAAGLSLLAPVVLALVHQDALGGAGCRALDVAGFVRAHVAGFVRGYGRRGARKAAAAR